MTVEKSEGEARGLHRLLVPSPAEEVATMEWAFVVFSKAGEKPVAKWVTVPALKRVFGGRRGEGV